MWLCALDLAITHGWKPAGSDCRPAADAASTDRLQYFRADGRRVSAHDATQLAACIDAGLARVSDVTVPLRGRSFGEEHTLALISKAMSGTAPSATSADAAIELLSGAPKGEARVLIAFLRGGSVSIRSTAGSAV